MGQTLIILSVIALAILGAVVLLRQRLREVDPLLRALQSRNHQRALELIQAGASVNVIGKYGSTPLMYAASQGALQTVEALVQRGARLDDPAIVRAAESGHLEIVQFLLRSGADPNIPNKGGTTALVYAAWKGHAAIVDLLISHGADVNVQPKAGSALSQAVARGHVSLVEQLLRLGADPNTRNYRGETPLIKCAFAATVCMHANKDNNWALAKQLVDILLEAGADAKAEDNKGRNALDYFVTGAGSSIATRFSRIPDKEAYMAVMRRFVAAGVDTSGALQSLAYWRARQSNEFFAELAGVLIQPTKL